MIDRGWEHDRVKYPQLKEIERLFRRLKGIRRVFPRFYKLDTLSIGFIDCALTAEALHY